ncbi:Hpt domain-containing protein [Alcanivorax sp.]|jgi:HPt (histidine-containing phosphotransfer) domain-containing protein|uniref:Hpt domain-containing protein n=1 Tax=Alcanivorax sp. TaxID=1872427 RepID=UPI0032D98B2C
MHDRSVLDAEVVSELQDIMGQDFQMLIESFQHDGEQRLAALDQAFAGGDADTLRSQAHSFKGSSSNLGAVRVAEVCMELETLASNGELASAPPLIDSLKRHFQQACVALSATLAPNGAG